MSRQYRSGRSQGWRVGSEVDQAAVLRACTGERMPLTTAERREAVRQLVARGGLSSNEAARRLGLAWRTVQRHRAAIRREAA